MRAPRTVLSWLPPRLRLPAAAGLIVFVAAVGTTQLALQLEGRQADAQLERVGLVYLDGLVASVRAALAAGDLGDVGQRFRAAFAEQQGISERALVALDAGGRVIASAGDPAILPEFAPGAASEAFRIDPATGIAWVMRTVDAGTGHWIGAGLDVSELLAARRRHMAAVVGIDLLIGALCGWLAYLALRRINRPVDLLIAQLESAAQDSPQPVPPAVVGAQDSRMRPLFEAYNRMTEGVRERERLFAELAEREQAAALGRLAATIAHEVRNPLGGLSTAVSTLRKFGHDAGTRDESLGLLERGIGSLDRIVTSTLNLHRPEQERRLTRADFEDLIHLVRPAAERDHVVLDSRVDLPAELSLGAQGVRQVLLNLLLNACEACRPGGRVTLEARIEGAELICIVSDQGEGMGPAAAERLAGGAAPDRVSKRLGMEVVVGLLGSLDGRASVRSEPGEGTVVRVALPLVPA